MTSFKWQKSEVRRRIQARGSESLDMQPLAIEARARMRSVLIDGAYGDPYWTPPGHQPQAKPSKKRSKQRVTSRAQPAPVSTSAKRKANRNPKQRQERLLRELKEQALHLERQITKVRENLAALERALYRKRVEIAAIKHQEGSPEAGTVLPALR